MKKCILIGALAALMLFAFTACEQQVPNFIEKTPTAMSVVSTPEYLVGEKADPNQIKVEIVYANGDVETKTAATLGMVATTLNGLQNKVSLSPPLNFAPMGFPNEKPRNVEAAGILGKSGAKEEA